MMAGVGELQKILETLKRLGARKLAALGCVGLFIFLTIGVSGYLLSRPQYEVLYTGLDKQDVARIVAALREANLTFDLSSDGGGILVEYGQTGKARMLLAERGLPGSSGGGYEIFDKLGSLGLTSFMQEVTRLRALEGELARTIQAMQGVKAARVHLVMPEEGTFRRAKQAASASVVVRLTTSHEGAVAQAIRHLVASAVPGMTIDLVTVLNSDGAVLASGADNETSAPARAANLERSISDAMQDNIRRTLTPMVGLRNLNVSVAVRLNTDKKQTNETIYNPDSRVERSVRVIKENQTAQNSAAQGAAGVDRNIPTGSIKNADGRQSNEENQKREELTNYEVSSKQISTVSGAYMIERLSVAVLVNKSGLLAGLGDQANNQQAMDKRLEEISELVSSAAGLAKERGDVVKVTAVNFADDNHNLEPIAGPGFLQLIMRQIGSIVTAVAALAAIAMLGIFVVRPIANSLIAHAPVVEKISESSGLGGMLEAPEETTFEPGRLIMPGSTQFNFGEGGQLDLGVGGQYSLPMGAPVFTVDETPRRAGQRRIDEVVSSDEEQAAAIFKDWIRTGAQA